MGSPLPPDPYAALGVTKDATSAAIKTAYRKLALKCHPDKFPDPTQKAEKSAEFHKIQQAYEILGDDDKRERYNAQVRLAELRKEALERQQARGGGTKAETRSSTAANYDIRVPPTTTAYATRGSSSRYDEQPRRSAAYEDDERLYDDARAKPRSTKYSYVRRASSPPRRERVRVFFNTSRDHSDRTKSRDQEKRRERGDKYTTPAHAYADSDESDNHRAFEEKRRKEAQRAAAYEEEDRRREEQRRNAERFKKEAEAERRRVEEERERERMERERETALREAAHREAAHREAAHREAARREPSRRSEEAVYDKWSAQHDEAKEYIKRSTRGASTSQDDVRPSAGRSSSRYEQVRSKDSDRPRGVRRASEKTKESRILSGIRHGRGNRDKDRKSSKQTEAAEYAEERRRPHLEKAESSPAAMKAAQARVAPERAQTMDPYETRREEAAPQPRMRRAETMPAQPSKSSRREKAEPNTAKVRTELPKHMHDSGYSSPSTPTVSDREIQPPASSRKTTTTTYRYGDNGDSYNTITVEPPSGSERDSRDGHEHRKRSSSPLRDRRRSRETEREPERSHEKAVPVRTMPTPTNSRYPYETVAESRRPAAARTTSTQRVPIARSPERVERVERVDPYERERGRSHYAEVMRDRDHERTRSHEDREFERGSRLYGEIPKQAGEPLRREPQVVRPTMKRNDSYNRDNVSFSRKIGPDDIHWAPRSRERIHDPEQFAYAYPGVHVPRPPMPARGYTTVN